MVWTSSKNRWKYIVQKIWETIQKGRKIFNFVIDK